MSHGVQYLEGPPPVVWLLFDIDNGEYPGKNYVRWFTTLEEARDFCMEQASFPHAARLSRPVKYVFGEPLEWP